MDFWMHFLNSLPDAYRFIIGDMFWIDEALKLAGYIVFEDYSVLKP